MGCPGDNRHEEDQWLAVFLTSSPGYAFDGKRIALDTAAIRVALKPRGEVQPNLALANTHWRLTHVTDGPAVGAPADPNAAVSAAMPIGQVDMQLYDDLVRINFDCTTLHGPAVVDGDSIRFGVLKPTSSTCTADQQRIVDDVRATLQGQVTANTSPYTLTVTHPSGRGLQFEVGPEAVSMPPAY